ncbi:23S rRNA (cytidine(2498)-2'-O)-methyltransferase RlmM [Shewanella sp. VB17]|uniref:23S rRNA (cytidine(2498)-2'-O)-methyltransferase RlmM n=1 Tax=Shewanella sp. VB17 TaxID=2739432 RepID=UPI0015644953|nr:23S rRNA (cytidine(2498)-2'-O)-methyltransferase RlmM [Shewanella sp. VB17]NRD75072.1 23S rRNA (cytidine(2498)-2'-O)-methyltransferase RlmM [Shewanella sp. VB17]
MINLFLYCRSGYEKECAAEIQHRATELDIGGFVKTNKKDGYVIFQCFNAGDASVLAQKIKLDSLIFTRQIFAAKELLKNLPENDRITPILAALSDVRNAGELRVETPDTNEAKERTAFCRKFTVPLRQKLKNSGHLLKKENSSRPIIHVCFVASGTAYVGVSFSNNSSPYPMGIPRLKMATDAPSRSNLKLDEAFIHFIPEEEHELRLSSGMNAVDLGACPGGWTYQLVRRGMFVAAIDNGAMDEALMETGQVKHYQADGFRFEPPRKNIYWLVCDMIEKPTRVADLVATWAIKGWFKEAIFNLKLPMKSRYQDVSAILANMETVLNDNEIKHFSIKCKHLYHDRDEVTVYLSLNPTQMS